MVKSIAIDMDGTLLNNFQNISEENKEAIEKAQNQGIEVIIATGRSYEEARYVLEQVDIECPIIAVNGAVVYTEDGQVIASNPMLLETVQKAVGFLETQEIYYEVYTSNGVYSKNYESSVDALINIFVTANPNIDPVKISEHAYERLQLGQVKSVTNYSELFSKSGLEFYKLLIFSTDFIKLQESVSEIRDMDNLVVTSSGRENIEVMSKDAQKGIALEKYLYDKVIPMNEAMAIGDNYNDVSMFERVGRSVAMGNAPLEIQEMCKHVTASNDENGVAQAVNLVLKDTAETSR